MLRALRLAYFPLLSPLLNTALGRDAQVEIFTSPSVAVIHVVGPVFPSDSNGEVSGIRVNHLLFGLSVCVQ